MNKSSSPIWRPNGWIKADAWYSSLFKMTSLYIARLKLALPSLGLQFPSDCLKTNDNVLGTLWGIMKMYLCAQSELSELHQHFKSANPTAGAMLNRSEKRKNINLSLQSDMQWKHCSTNDSFISPRWAGLRIGVQTGSSWLCFSHNSMDKCHSQRSGRYWGTWRGSFAESDSIWQCAFSPPYWASSPLFSPSLQTTKSAVFVVSPNTPHFSSLLLSQWTCKAWCLSSLSAAALQGKVWCGSEVNFASETWCMCEPCQGILASAGVATTVCWL